ncbi:MAG: phospholipase D family protein [Syntrophorhabdaceae bacterium]|nr:phospholipase D family protein [Syntrophorhabdaceae bacterium]
MKKILVICLFAITICVAYPYPSRGTDLTLNNTPTIVCFSPGGKCTNKIIKETETATREILVQMFSFTSAPLRNALVKAQKRGVDVGVILDKGEQKNRQYKTAKTLSKGGVSVYIDDKHTNSHNKIMIIDRETVITGSFNYTYPAESKNAENILIIKSGELAKVYADNWLSHRQHSRKY